MEYLNININNKYINELNNKHQQMRKKIEKNFSNKQQLKEGAYNKLFKIGDDVVIRQVDSNKCVKNGREAKLATFNNMFVPSLLKECGEDTIITGRFNVNGEEMLYMEKAEGSLMEKFIECHKLQGQNWPGAERIKSTLNNNPDMSDDDIQITLLTMILESFTTANFVSLNNHRFAIADVNKCNKDVLTKFLSEDNMKIIARHLCKVFLFQMFDRKPENLLVKNGTDGKKKFIETDFDDIKEITCLFADIQSDDNTKVSWQNNLVIIWKMYNFFIDNKIKDSGKTEKWNTIFKDTIEEYTITEGKMENIIYDIAVKNKYFGLSAEDLINDIEIKLTSWKKMLDTTTKNNNDTWVETFKATMENTLETLQKFDRDKITEIVNKARKPQSQALPPVYKDNTSADCNLRDYIPNWMKTCCGLCQGG